MKPVACCCLLISFLLLSALPAAAEGSETCPGPGNGHRQHGGRPFIEQGPPPPFGAFCPNRHADHYGARQPLSTQDEARERLGRYFNRPPHQIQLRKESRMGYIADILNPDGTLFDRVIIDKRSGRIRSIR